MTKRALLLPILLLLSIASAFAAEYKLGTGDVIKVTVYGHNDLSTTARIGETGKISFPLLGEVAVVDLTIGQATQRIATYLKTGGYVERPQVNVQVEKFHSPLVSIMGEVSKPGKYPVRDPEGEDVKTVSDLLALAGGLRETAADYLTILKKQPDGKSVHQRVDLIALLRRGDTSQNLSIKEGDVLFVPRMEVFYIYGEVQKPGQFRLERDMTLMQALAMGGGLTQRGTQRGIEVRRKNGDGTIHTVKSKLEDKLLPDDVVYVKESMF